MSDRVADYDYALPPELIAQRPTTRRDESRMLVVPAAGPFGHRRTRDIVDIVAPGDLVVVNESKVLPARLRGMKPTGARAEVLLLHPVEADGEVYEWEALVRPGRKLRRGDRVDVGEHLTVCVVDVLPSGNRRVRLETPLRVEEAIDRYGEMPLPPYIDRATEPSDRERYQTVYARAPGSVAAPTAGLHFTEEMLEALEAQGVERAAVTLHVGIGTFRPVEADDPADHAMHVERYHVPEEVVDAVTRTRAAGGRVWAVGTTAVRTLEAAASTLEAPGAMASRISTPYARLRAGWGETDLFIRPPYDFRVVDGLLTNFHLPRSTLIMLVAALAGHERTMAAYAEAVRERYRFYSYGDAMLVLPPPRLAR